MNPTIENIVTKVVAGPIAWSRNAMRGGRAVAGVAASALLSSREPTRRVAKAGLKLNKITHSSIADMVKLQAEIVEGTVEAGAKRLELIADADSLRTLVKDQVALMPETRDRVAGDARKTVKLFAETRDELVEAFGKAPSKPARKTRARKAPVKRAAKKAAKKAAPAKKAAKRKTATRKAPSRKTTASK